MLHKQAILITSKGDIVKLKPGSTFRAPYNQPRHLRYINNSETRLAIRSIHVQY